MESINSGEPMAATAVRYDPLDPAILAWIARGQPEHRHGVAGDEVAVLVEDAVVGQVVLGVARHDAAAGDDRGEIGRAHV